MSNYKPEMPRETFATHTADAIVKSLPKTRRKKISKILDTKPNNLRIVLDYSYLSDPLEQTIELVRGAHKHLKAAVEAYQPVTDDDKRLQILMNETSHLIDEQLDVLEMSRMSKRIAKENAEKEKVKQG